MSAITEARALLQRVREGARFCPWYIDMERGEVFDGDKEYAVYSAAESLLVPSGVMDGWDAALIVLMSDPALLDAIDRMLRNAESGMPYGRYYYWDAERIASALVQQGKARGL